jgi:HSP20 family molecular chaperone IbpA
MWQNNLNQTNIFSFISSSITMVFVPSIPVDIYDSHQELVIIIPLGWIEKETLQIAIKDFKLKISWIRKKPTLRHDFTLLQSECYRWVITQSIDLPNNIIYDRIHSTLTKENILLITLPKYGIPDEVKVTIERP